MNMHAWFVDVSLIGHAIFYDFDNNDKSNFDKTIIKVSHSIYLIASVDPT